MKKKMIRKVVKMLRETMAVTMVVSMLLSIAGCSEQETAFPEYEDDREMMIGGWDSPMNTLEDIQLAKDMGVTVCDCYSQWKRLSQTQDITHLLVNRINHPTREMHELFAQMLFDTIFSNEHSVEYATDDAMYSETENGKPAHIDVLEYKNFYH